MMVRTPIHESSETMCSFTNFKVNYTPDNNYMTYHDGGMTGYDINLSFSEIVPIYLQTKSTVVEATGSDSNEKEIL